VPDKRQHRGRHPQDEEFFASRHVGALRRAVEEYSWLLTREYAPGSALKLVGDRYVLTARQRLAVMRSACGDAARDARAARRVAPAACAGQSLGIDGYNVLITVESALAGGVIFVGRDGCYRDLASIHGTYRKVEETVPALTLMMNYVCALRPAHVDYYFDQPVSNSGRLKVLLADLLERCDSSRIPSNIMLVPSPDAVLAQYPGIIATTDSAVLDRCDRWLDLAGAIIEAQVPHARKIRLAPGDSAPDGGVSQ